MLLSLSVNQINVGSIELGSIRATPHEKNQPGDAELNRAGRDNGGGVSARMR